jgi:hypothetical protein
MPQDSYTDLEEKLARAQGELSEALEHVYSNIEPVSAQFRSVSETTDGVRHSFVAIFQLIQRPARTFPVGGQKPAKCPRGIGRRITHNFPHSRRSRRLERGRVQRQVRAAFAMIGKPVLTTSEVLSLAYGHLELLGERPQRWHYEHPSQDKAPLGGGAEGY